MDTMLVKKLNSFKELMNILNIEVVVKYDEDNSFYAYVQSLSKKIAVLHGYDPNGSKSNKTATVDILIHDQSTPEYDYVICMTEGSIEDYPWNVDEARRITTELLNNNYEIQISKIRKRKSLHFKNDALVYKVATQTKLPVSWS